MDFFIRGNRSNFALSQKKPTQSQVRSTSVSNPFQVRSLYRRYMPHDREFARQFCRLLSNHGNIYTNLDKHHLQHLRGLLSFAKIKTIWHSKYGITKGVSNSDSPWRRKESQWGAIHDLSSKEEKMMISRCTKSVHQAQKEMNRGNESFCQGMAHWVYAKAKRFSIQCTKNKHTLYRMAGDGCQPCRLYQQFGRTHVIYLAMPKLVTTFANRNQSQEYKDLLYRYLQKHKEK